MTEGGAIYLPQDQRQIEVQITAKDRLNQVAAGVHVTGDRIRARGVRTGGGAPPVAGGNL